MFVGFQEFLIRSLKRLIGQETKSGTHNLRMDKFAINSDNFPRFVLITDTMLSEPLIQFGNSVIRTLSNIRKSILIPSHDQIDESDAEFHTV